MDSMSHQPGVWELIRPPVLLLLYPSLWVTDEYFQCYCSFSLLDGKEIPFDVFSRHQSYLV